MRNVRPWEIVCWSVCFLTEQSLFIVLNFRSFSAQLQLDQKYCLTIT